MGRSLGKALREISPDLQGISYYLAEGAAAGQVVPHAHLHVIPRQSGDGCGLRLHKGAPHRAERADLAERAAELHDALNAAEISSV